MKLNCVCIGLGNVGRSWAIRFATHNHIVKVFDSSNLAIEESLKAIAHTLIDLEKSHAIPSASEAMENIQPTADLSEAVGDADYIQESIVENSDRKREVFSRLDVHSPEQAIIASSTSEILGSLLFEHLPGRKRCLVAHPLNPPHVIPLVELCPSPWTEPEILDRTSAFLTTLGQTPILVKKEINGFIANRLQLAVLGEAIHLVGEGYCSVHDIDIALTQGLAPRWALVGPFETGHLNASKGYRSYIDVYGETHRRIIDSLNTQYEWPTGLIDEIHEELTKATSEEEVPSRQRWRDNQLEKLLTYLNSREKFSE